ncbi:MAG: hypothetical protein QOG54_2204 [Actinomycetota bacterium]|nr:hypothetical protein [Actinomycetota bacterium]
MDRGLIVDLAVVGIIVFAIVRGYLHGSAREAFGLAGILIGLFVAPFLAGPLGSAVHGVSGLGINFARLIALIVLIAAIEVAFAIWGIRTTKGIQISGPRALDRAGGIVLAVFRAITVSALFLYAVLAISASYPDSPGYAQGVQESTIGTVLADPDSPFTSFYDSAINRTNAMRALTLWVRQQTELRVRVPSDRVEFSGTEDIKVLPDGGRTLMGLINKERAAHDLPPLEWCESCAEVALAQSKDMYVNGYFSHVDGDDHDPFERMRAADIAYEAAGENLAIAQSLADAHEGLMASPDHRANILRPAFDEVGIGVFEGPYGVMVTQVFRKAP